VTTIRLDRVFTFGEQLSFLIPHEWIEGLETDHYLYHEPNTDSGWLRVSLITLKGPGKGSKERLKELLSERAQKEAAELHESGENIVVEWVQISEESGDPICNYWWAVGHSSGPNLGYEALFSYTILQERSKDAETQETVSLIGTLVADARFTGPSIV
jgi:hypothetical protein